MNTAVKRYAKRNPVGTITSSTVRVASEKGQGGAATGALIGTSAGILASLQVESPWAKLLIVLGSTGLGYLVGCEVDSK